MRMHHLNTVDSLTSKYVQKIIRNDLLNLQAAVVFKGQYHWVPAEEPGQEKPKHSSQTFLHAELLVHGLKQLCPLVRPQMASKHGMHHHQVCLLAMYFKVYYTDDLLVISLPLLGFVH